MAGDALTVKARKSSFRWKVLTRTLTRLVLLAGAAFAPSPALALDAPIKPRASFVVPLPPVRPPDVGGELATVPAPSAPPVSFPANSSVPSGEPIEEPPPQPRSLPPASRKRMRECGVEWQKMKQSGAAADKIWYDFAQICLTK